MTLNLRDTHLGLALASWALEFKMGTPYLTQLLYTLDSAVSQKRIIDF